MNIRPGWLLAGIVLAIACPILSLTGLMQHEPGLIPLAAMFGVVAGSCLQTAFRRRR